MLAGEPVVEVICEWHEDYVVTWAGQPRQLTSVKHLEGDQPRWTLYGLLTDGGVKHLYERWVDTGERCKVRLQTNSGLRPDSGEGPGALAEACSTQDSKALDRSEHVLWPAVFTDKYARPACAALDLPEEMSGRLYDCVAELVARAARSNRRSVVADLLRSADGYGEHVLDLLAAKLIDSQRVHAHIRTCLFPSKPSRPLEDADIPLAPILVQKLQKGGFGPTMVTRARHLRVTWEQQRRSLEHRLGNPNPLDSVAANLYRLAERAELELEGYEEPYGRQLHEQLTPLVAEMSAAEGSILLDEDLLWGGIFALTHACKIWWSPEFTFGGEA